MTASPLSQFKAALTKGAEFTAMFLPTRIVGNLSTAEIPGKTEGRIVERVTSHTIYFKKPNGDETRLDMPKAAEVAVVDGAFVITDERGKHVVTYTPGQVAMAA